MAINRTLALIALVSASAALAGCGRGEASEAATEPPREIPVVVAPVTVADAAARHSGTTHLEADEEAGVPARVGGEVTRILVDEGQFVEAGEVLATLDGERLRLEMERSKAALDKLRATYRRNVALHERGLVAEGAFENLRFEMDALEAAYQLARLEYDYTRVRAPIAGVVSGREITVGSSVQAGQVLFRVTNLDSLVAYVHVPQRALHRFEAGQAARLSMAAWPAEDFPATVTRVSPTIEPDTGTFRVTLAVPSGEGRLRPGMSGKLDIVYEIHRDTLMVPEDALLAEDAEAAVFVVDGGIAHRRTVATGITSDGRIEILSGLSAGESVVVVGQGGLRDGAAVDSRAAVQEI
ncbi:MAG: efflux RND transporter periplasmic adaptor subunit [Gammaproteobacteria bacterium]